MVTFHIKGVMENNEARIDIEDFLLFPLRGF